MYLHYLQKHHSQQILQKNFQLGDLVLLVGHPTARCQYPLAHVVKVFTSEKGITRRVRVMTADAEKLNPHIPCKRTCLDRDSTKVALVEFPSVNPLSEGFQLNPSENNDLDAAGLQRNSPSAVLWAGFGRSSLMT